MLNWKVNDSAVLSVTVSKGGVPVTGLSPSCTLIRVSDGQYYDWAGGWQVAPTSSVMPELYSGYYELQFDQSTADPDKWEDYRALYQSTTPEKFFRGEIHTFRSLIGESLSVTTAGTVGDALRVVFGALYANAILDETVYNTKGVLTSGRVRLFSTPAAAAAATEGAADDSEGEWARFEITATAEAAPNEQYTQNFRMVRTK